MMLSSLTRGFGKMKNTSRLFENRVLEDSDALVSQLEREVACLERQLDRLRLLNCGLDPRTENTYQDMIGCRKNMISQIACR